MPFLLAIEKEVLNDNKQDICCGEGKVRLDSVYVIREESYVNYENDL